MKTIYVVTSGSYSDYGINAVFDDKELAEKFVKLHGSNYDIEEYECNKHKDMLLKNMFPHYVQMQENGDVIQCGCYDFDDFKVKINFKEYYKTPLQKIMVVLCYARDKEHAIKIASEKRMQVIALNRWGIDNPLNE